MTINLTTPKKILDKLGTGVGVTATDLDIRDLNSTDDEIKAIIRADTLGNQTSDLKVTLDGESVGVTGTFWQTTQPVSGTFWQTTQPVSGTFWQTTQPVSGTFWQGTQPVTQTAIKTHNVYSFFEYIAENGTLVGNDISLNNGTGTLYTVPANKVCYIVSATLGARNNVAGGGDKATIKINNLDVMMIGLNDLDDSHDSTTSNFTIPIKITATQTIQVRSDSTGITARGSFAGYEIDA